MRTNNKIYVKTQYPDQFIKVTTDYTKGGPNMAGSYSSRGVYTYVQPVTIKDYGDGIKMESFMMFSGYKMLQNELKRKSDKVTNMAHLLVIGQIENKMGPVYEIVKRVAAEKGYVI